MLITRAARAALSASLRPRPPLPPHPRRAQAAMFQAIKGLFGASAEQGCGKCSVCDPEVLGRCKPAEPGSVTPHRHHVLVRLPAPAGAGAPAAGEGSWWPESVDRCKGREMGIVRCFCALLPDVRAGGQVGGGARWATCVICLPPLFTAGSLAAASQPSRR